MSTMQLHILVLSHTELIGEPYVQKAYGFVTSQENLSLLRMKHSICILAISQPYEEFQMAVEDNANTEKILRFMKIANVCTSSNVEYEKGHS